MRNEVLESKVVVLQFKWETNVIRELLYRNRHSKTELNFIF